MDKTNENSPSSRKRQHREHEINASALEHVEKRLRKLEAVHSLKDPKDDRAGLKCDGAAQVADQIEQLGSAYNELDEHLDGLLKARNDHGTRLGTLEERVRACEEGAVTSGTAPNGTETISASPAIDPTVLDQLTEQKSSLDQLELRLEQLESAPRQPRISSHATHDLAQDLIRRLGNGEKLNTTLSHQLQSSLSTFAFPSLPTPSLTDRPTRHSTAESVANREPQPKGKRGRPRKTSLASGDGSEAAPAAKRPIGRPRKDAVGHRKPSISSNLSASIATSEISKESETPATPLLAKPGSTAERTTEPASGKIPQEDGTGDVDTSMDVEDEPEPDIPPERRSGRKPKPIKHFGEPKSWKEVSSQINGLRPSAPMS